jgi:hypothetical protein
MADVQMGAKVTVTGTEGPDKKVTVTPRACGDRLCGKACDQAGERLPNRPCCWPWIPAEK